MIANNQLFATLLHDHGYSLTQSRRIIFGALSTYKPLTMKQLTEACPVVDRASIYRTVALFESIGIVRRIYTGWKYHVELSDNFSSHHHHASCSNCGQIIPLHEDTALEEALRGLAKQHSFYLTGHEIELIGYCENCRSALSRK